MSKNRIKALEAYDWRGDPLIADLPDAAHFLLFRLTLAADERGAVCLSAVRHDLGMDFMQFERTISPLLKAGFVERGAEAPAVLPAVRKHLGISDKRAEVGRKGWETMAWTKQGKRKAARCRGRQDSLKQKQGE